MLGIFFFKEIKEQGPFFQVVVYVLVEKTEANKLTLEFFACCGERALFIRQGNELMPNPPGLSESACTCVTDRHQFLCSLSVHTSSPAGELLIPKIPMGGLSSLVPQEGFQVLIRAQAAPCPRKRLPQ